MPFKKASRQPFFENVSKTIHNFKIIKVEVFVSWSVFKLEKKTKKIREAEEQVLLKTLRNKFYRLKKAVEFVFELPQIYEG